MKLEKKTSCECLYSDTQEISCISEHGDVNNNTVNVYVERDQCFSAKATSITVKVDDMLNAVIFYSGKITTSDYEIIKAEHSLLIDFDDFVGYLINLLRKCNQNDEKTETVYTLQLVSKVTCESSENFLQVVETNHLRKFCHLSISVVASGDKEIRETFCKSFRKLQEVNVSLGDEVQKKTEELQTLTKELHEKTAALEKVIKVHEEDVREIRFQCAATMSREKEKIDKMFSECNEKHKSELVQREEQHTREKHDWECRLKEIKTKLCETDEKCRVLKLDNEELSGVVERLQETDRSTRREIEILKSQMEAKNSVMREKQATREMLVARYKVLLQDFSLAAKKVKSLQEQLDRSLKSEDKLRNLLDEGERRQREQSERAAQAEQRCRQLEEQLTHSGSEHGRLQAELASKERALRSSEATASVLSRQLRQLQLQQHYPRSSAGRTPLLLASARSTSSGSCGDPLQADTFRSEPQSAAVSGATSSYFANRF